MSLDHSYYDQNINLLKENHPEAWRVVMDYAEPLPGEIHTAKDGNPLLVISGPDGKEICFHDKNDTLAELQSYYNLVPISSTGVAAFIGMGLGYTPPAMLEDHKNLRHLLMLEPHTGIFLQALHTRDLSVLLTDPRVLLGIGPDVNVKELMFPINRALQLESFHVLKHNPCFHFAPDLYRRIHDEVFSFGNSFNMEGNTLSAYGKKFIENRFKHLRTIHHHQLLENLKDRFKDKPAIIVAGGPSLDKNIHLLTKAKDKALIIAADTVLPALKAHGLTPDFVSAIDMQDIAIEKIISLADQPLDTALVCTSWLNARIPKVFPARQVYWTFTAKNMEAWLNSLAGGKIMTTGAGTVAQLNFITAIMLGCSPIIFVGQDLAFSKDQRHASHTNLTREISPYESKNKNMIWVDAYGGNGQVATTRSFLGFKTHFEDAIAAEKDRLFINATEGGVRIKGTEELPLETVIERHCKDNLNIKETLLDNECSNKMPSSLRLMDSLSRIQKDIKNSSKKIQQLEKHIQSIKKQSLNLQKKGISPPNSQALPHAMRREMQELDAISLKLDNEKIWPLLDEITMEGLRQSERLNHEIQQLENRPEQFLNWLLKSLERLKIINDFRKEVLNFFSDTVNQTHAFMQKEEILLKKSQKNNAIIAASALLQLYSEHEEINLLEKVFEQLKPQIDESLVYLYHGIIAAHRCLFDRMETNFTKAINLEPSFEEVTRQIRIRIARFHNNYYSFIPLESPVFRVKTKLKAFRYNSGLPEISEKILFFSRRLIEESEKFIKEPTLSFPKETLQLWHKEQMENPNLLQLVTPEKASVIHSFYARYLITKENLSEAANALQAATKLTPDNPELHLLLADIFFATKNFPEAITALDKAVALDRSLGVEWEHIGDSLMASGQAEDAAAVYEKSFLALPENLHLLKKIGDAYLAINQPEAAREAYRLLNEKLSAAGMQNES
ncbi:hypothetical protein LZ24_01516 [Desulfobotulus alkaliphilus]|uniref:6-hydroxymethylpterin diphosphokinase MptE-like domain-containing protein n=1 Tax=Desulfobotulus alkaliphilus TaxID=622671 RepID=A0A562RUV9_9BACT|nr:6-hydroxymethylpterin diphosphokinase MptE-like protein [Desulfobotulus alkaliphilus]TWI72374.1 hypothetical protein LZ24_01516 [Desulfobotulus alkaliphilus]